MTRRSRDRGAPGKPLPGRRKPQVIGEMIMDQMGIDAARAVDFDAIDKLLAEPPDKAAVQLQRVKEREASERAIEGLRHGLIDRPDDIVKLNALSYELRKLERTDELIAVYRRILALDPGRADLRHMIDAAAGAPAPARASDDFVRSEFDGFADKFDSVLTNWLEYRAPELVAAAIRRVLGAGAVNQLTIDMGCGTGLAAPLLRPISRRLDGIDLSPKMIDKARERGGYDALVVTEIGKYLATHRNTYTLAVACDVFCYFGELAEVFGHTRECLRPQGLFAFTVEHHGGEGFQLQTNGRYAHAPSFVRAAATGAGFDIVEDAEVQLRMELHRPVIGGCYVLRRG